MIVNAKTRFSVPVEAYFAKESSSIPRLAPSNSDLINLAPGDPVLPVPDQVIKAVEASLRNDRHGYTPPTGIDELRQAISEKFKRVNGLTYGDDEIVVGMGSKQVIVAALMATVRDGDEVIVATPSFSMYPDMARLSRADPVIVRGGKESGHKLTPDALVDALTDRTRWVILNTPNNPTGVVYSTEELAELMEVVAQHPSAQVISDEIYEQLIYDGSRHVSPAGLNDQARERVLTVSGLSKTYGMTGWRIGYAGGPADLIKAMGAVQLLTTTCPPRVTQAAAVAALGIGNDLIEQTVASLRERRDMVVQALSPLAGLEVSVPSAGLYVIVDCSEIIGSSRNDLGSGIDIVNRLRTEFGVMLMPGELFDMPGCIRVSFCIPVDKLEQGLERLRSGLVAVSNLSEEDGI